MQRNIAGGEGAAGAARQKRKGPASQPGPQSDLLPSGPPATSTRLLARIRPIHLALRPALRAGAQHVFGLQRGALAAAGAHAVDRTQFFSGRLLGREILRIPPDHTPLGRPLVAELEPGPAHRPILLIHVEHDHGIGRVVHNRIPRAPSETVCFSLGNACPLIGRQRDPSGG